MAVITIGTVQSIREPENYAVTPDDRQELVKCINGVFPVDAGNYPEGDIFSFTAIFNPASWTILQGYWIGRIKVQVTDMHNVTMTNMRIIIKKYEYVKKHNFWQITFEIWRV